MTKHKATRALLINPPIYDLRFDWARWHQPCGLLQVGSLLRTQGTAVKLVDCLQPLRGQKVDRKKLGTIRADDTGLWRWHYGLWWHDIDKRMEELKEERWKPDTIYVCCLMTFWWEGTRDLVQHVRRSFPKTPIVLGGVYSSLCPDHVKRNIHWVSIDSELGKLARKFPADLSLYETPPHFAGISLRRSSSADRIVSEIETKVGLGVREFAFFDNEIPGEKPNHFENVLDLIIARRLNIRLLALGNLPPKALNGRLVTRMREAGFRQIFLQDDAAFNAGLPQDLGRYEESIELLLRYGGYRPRTEDVTAMVLAGVPGENLEHVAERLTRLAHIVGSVNLVPYQPTPGTKVYEQYRQYLPADLEMQNGKLFPFAKLNYSSFSDYQELTRLAALLNSKYRSTTFDFLGDNEIAQMIRQSIAQEGWKPKLRETLPLLPR